MRPSRRVHTLIHGCLGATVDLLPNFLLVGEWSRRKHEAPTDQGGISILQREFSHALCVAVIRSVTILLRQCSCKPIKRIVKSLGTACLACVGASRVCLVADAWGGICQGEVPVILISGAQAYEKLVVTSKQDMQPGLVAPSRP